jgi:hypothetical protein
MYRPDLHIYIYIYIYIYTYIHIFGRSHVPYLESKLTTLLRAAFGGNSRTYALITGSPDDRHVEETLQVRVCMDVYVFVCVCVYIYIYIYNAVTMCACMCVYTHTHTYIYKCTDHWQPWWQACGRDPASTCRAMWFPGKQHKGQSIYTYTHTYMQAVRFGEECSMISNQATQGAMSLDSAAKSIDEALAMCQQGIRSLGWLICMHVYMYVCIWIHTHAYQNP